MSRRYVTIYLGEVEKQALTHCPPGTKRGQWINHLAGQLATWHPDQWATFLAELSPPPRPHRGKLSVALPAPLAADLDARRGHVSLADILRTALLRAAGVAYTPMPSLPPAAPTAGVGEPLPAVMPPVERSVREPAPEYSIDPHVAVGEDPDAQVSWHHVDADDEAVATIRARFRQGKPRGEACYPDITPQAQAEIANELLTASTGASIGFWLGVRHSYDHVHTFTGLVDPDATRKVLDDVVVYCERSADLEITTYPLGPDPHQVLLEPTGHPPRRLGEVTIIDPPPEPATTAAPNDSPPRHADTDRLDRLAQRTAVTHSELAALRGEFHEHLATEDPLRGEHRAAIEALLARVEELEEQVADHNKAFETLFPILDQFKIKWWK